MESLSEPVVAIFFAAVLISLFAILRLATRSPSSPAWLKSVLAAYMIAVPLTLGFAVSLAYVGYALQPLMGVLLASVATVAIHLALLAVFRMLLPIKDEAPVTKSAKSAFGEPQASAA